MSKRINPKTGGIGQDLPEVSEKITGRGNHPNSKANLNPWEKGESGNPDGRPKKYLKLKKSLDKFGRKTFGQWDIGVSGCDNYKDEVLFQIWSKATKGSISHIKILAELGCLDEEG
jgi:hypothetical protein|tara:strand:- start:239 stop:586 length:348 start_codon:yes stop_codon:yes gene_type:complete